MILAGAWRERRLAPTFLLLGFLAFTATAEPGTPSSATPEFVATGDRREGDLVAMNRAVTIDGEVAGSVVAVGGSVFLNGLVKGDLIVLGGSLTVEGNGRVSGNVLTIGSDPLFLAGSSATRSIGGRLANFAALEAAFLTELKTSPLHSASLSPLLLSFRLLILTIWLVLGSLLLLFGSRRISSAASSLVASAPLLGVLGTLTVLSSILLSAFFLSVLPARTSLLLVALLVTFLAAAKVFGLVALLLVLGRGLSRNARRGDLFFGDPAAFSLGLLVLGAISLLPGAGAVAWALASLVGIGAALATQFGGADRRSSPAG